MSRRLTPLNWLRAFESVAQHLSFTDAARDLHMTQSAVSQQIKALESHLGRALFHRRPKAIELTETGITYLPVVRDAFRTLSRGTRAITGDADNVVQLQCNLTFATHWLAPRLGRFRAAHPDVRLNIMTDLWEPRAMAEGADVEIRFSLGPSETTRAELLCRNEYYPVAAPGTKVTLDNLAEQPLYDCSNILCNWAAWAEDLPMVWPNPEVTYATTFSVSLAAAMSGAGLALGHDAIAKRYIDEGVLIAPFEHRAQMQEAYYLVLSPSLDRGYARGKGALEFAGWIRAEMGLRQ